MFDLDRLLAMAPGVERTRRYIRLRRCYRLGSVRRERECFGCESRVAESERWWLHRKFRERHAAWKAAADRARANGWEVPERASVEGLARLVDTAVAKGRSIRRVETDAMIEGLGEEG